MFEIIPSYMYTPLVCVAIGGLLMAGLMSRKKRLSKQLEENQLRKEKLQKNEELAKKYLEEHPELNNNKKTEGSEE